MSKATARYPFRRTSLQQRRELLLERSRLLRAELPGEQFVRRAKVKEQVLAQAAVLARWGRGGSSGEECGQRKEGGVTQS